MSLARPGASEKGTPLDGYTLHWKITLPKIIVFWSYLAWFWCLGERSWSLLSVVACFNQRILSLVFARALSKAVSSVSRYDPCLSVARRKWASIAFVSESANCAPVCTHLSFVPSSSDSLIALATNWIRYSEQDGGAVREIKSYKDLQSVTERSGYSFWVATEMADGIFGKASSGFLHCVHGSWSQLQKIRNHDSWSTDDANAMVSAANVLVTTLWIFLDPHVIGLIGHWTLELISLWVATIMCPACESGLLWEEKDASLKTMNLKSLGLMDLIVIVTSWWCLASWRSLFPSFKVSMVALFIDDWRRDNRLERSGLVWVAAYCKLPINPRNANLSSSVTASSGWVLRLTSILIGGILQTYLDWLNVMLKSPCCWTSMPVKVKPLVLWLPNGNFFSSFWICSLKYASPPPIPSSTWIPTTPARRPGCWPSEGCRSTKRHGSIGLGSKLSFVSSSTNVQYHKNGASTRPYAPLFNLASSCDDMFMALLSSGTGSIMIKRFSWGFPWRKAAFTSNDWRVHLWDDTSCKAIILDVRPSVGLSRGMISSEGSIKPRVTTRAFAFLPLAWFGASEAGSVSFHVRIQRHFMIWESGIWFLSTLEMVPVLIQFWTSVSLAAVNCARSAGVSSESLTSVRCFFAVVARRAHDSLSSGTCSWIGQGKLISNSHRHALPWASGSCRAPGASVHTRLTVARVGSSPSIDPSSLGWEFPESVAGSSLSGSGCWSDPSVWMGCASFSKLGEGVVSVGWGMVSSKFSGVVDSGWDSSWMSPLDMFWICWCIWVMSSGRSGPSGCPSSGTARRTCSGAPRYNLPAVVHQTVWFPSCMITLRGPYHRWRGGSWFWSSLHSITHSPRWNTPLLGQDLWILALRNTSLLSAAWYARRAASLSISICLNSLGWSSSSSESAFMWEGIDSSLKTDPGSRECLPNTIISGAYPFRTEREFLEWVHWFKPDCKSWYDFMGYSRSTLVSISWRNLPWRSMRPFFQWLSGSDVLHLIPNRLVNCSNAALFISVPASMKSSLGGPAQLIQFLLMISIRFSVDLAGAATATW